jgi:hypothetical protein
MKKIRFIHFASTSGTAEGLFITDNLDTEADEFISGGFEVVSDTVQEVDLSGDFPINYTFNRE